VSVFNRTTATMEGFVAQHPDKKLVGAKTMEEFVEGLESPRKVMIMVQAGGPVDAVVGQLVPLLDKGDLIIDGGNSLYTDTERRAEDLEGKGLLFIGTGVSGGEEGALKGPSIMPGGPEASWEIIKPIFEAISANVDGDPCVTLLGPGGAGHYVKMIHNGIEYGDMQLICEAYQIFKTAGFTTEEMAAVFEEWNTGDLESYLIQITSKIFTIKDEETGKPIVDLIMDRAGQKGTGRWTVMSGVENAFPPSTKHGADIRFHGVVRDTEDGETITGIDYSCYPDMAEGELEKIASAMLEDNPDHLVFIHHCLGFVAAGDEKQTLAFQILRPALGIGIK